MRKPNLLSLACIFAVSLASLPAGAQELSGTLADLTAPHDYVQKRVSSYDRTGGNALEETGPAHVLGR